ncbi:entry/fusion complex component [Western grey kangaroopox virus]|uniref:Entry-fusion complex protein OPG086 n=1 Tax=Western grey kangaroopox virus TaxID=1566307 RepID=A0A2C9DSL2_9POXV|nr:entry/fusion complex component [Western grey kangaroopox virus]ATI20995.1 entry/fusion complex component [Western grey kangaroopox virus]
MALENVVFFVIFIFLYCFLNWSPVNKLDLALAAARARHSASAASESDRYLSTTLFISPGMVSRGTMRGRYSEEKRTFTVRYRGRDYVYHTDRESDMRKLLPLLLLSK